MKASPSGSNNAKLPPAVFLMGPTSTGKTELAVELVQRFPFEIISVDSVMIFRGMDIGTAKPDPSILRIAPHRLIDILDPSEAYSAGRFREDALSEMQQILSNGRIPLLVGGTMLYFRALEKGFSDLPRADPDIRARLEAQALECGWSKMHQRLAEVDPEAASRIHKNDTQRIQRALEVYEITGRPLSQLQDQGVQGSVPFRFTKLALIPTDREALGQRIQQRFKVMLKKGFLDEVRHFYERGDLGPEMPSMRAVGYRQAWKYLAGEVGEDQWVEDAMSATRQYAKRQMTWLRSEADVHEVPMESGSVLDKALKHLKTSGFLHDLGPSNMVDF